MKKYNVTGMSCAACAAAVTRAVERVDGVTECRVSLLTNSMTVEGDGSPAAVIAAVKAAGYGASEQGASEKRTAETAENTLPRRLIASVLLLLPLMYLSMGHGMFGFPLPEPLSAHPLTQGILQLLLTGAIAVVNGRFFVSGAKSLWHRAPTMDALIAIGAGTAFGYSVWLLLAMSAGGRTEHLYFESAAMILTFITLGKTLEAYAKGKTTTALEALARLAPTVATVERDGEEQTVPVEQIAVGDVFLLRPGDQVPVDGVVLEGGSAVDESALTGESVPVEKAAGDAVCAATVNRSGFLRCRATRIGGETTLSRIIQMVSDASASKAPVARMADRAAAVFVPVILAIAFVTAVVWLTVGGKIDVALSRAIAVLVISCPCALGLATPVAIMVGSGVSARQGILFKTAAAIESAGRVKTVVLDKTGTVTNGTPSVTDVIPAEGCDEQTLLALAAGLEAHSEHPFAGAIVSAARAKGVPLPPATEFEALPGRGVTAVVEGKRLEGGSVAYLSEKAPPAFCKRAEMLADSGKTPLFFTIDGAFSGLIAVADTVREDSAQAISRLRETGLSVVMLTGDNERTARAVAEAVGIETVIAGVLPEGKAQAIRELSRDGKTAMVGDGVNDAPALTEADVGIAIGAGTDVAADAADIVLMGDSLCGVVNAIALGRKTLRNIRQNLGWAFFYNAIGIPAAAGVFGWQMSPALGAAAMCLSSVCVVTNALRLRLFSAYTAEKPAHTNDTKENTAMETTMKIDGMMCAHCERHVREALEKVPGVTEAQVSHTAKTAVVRTDRDVSYASLVDAVTDAGYTVLD